MLREARKNMPLSVQEQGVWPRCGQGTSRWVGLTYKVNSSYFYLYLHVQQQAWFRSKNMIKALDPGLKSLRDVEVEDSEDRRQRQNKSRCMEDG